MRKKSKLKIFEIVTFYHGCEDNINSTLQEKNDTWSFRSHSISCKKKTVHDCFLDDIPTNLIFDSVLFEMEMFLIDTTGCFIFS
ncbi:unnamed protein product [Larinioides sclopetarius]|uniref:Uncharacterized protein n=1 Tax=Larinioides sclopetarius TaxID=280406 RepID=A0AAV1YU74_9ARAC